MFRLFLSVFVCTTVTAQYHLTDDLLNEVQTHCHGPLKCRMVEGKLLVDWETESEDRVFFVFNEHARERVTGELALQVIRRLHTWNPSVRVTIVPVFNAWGRRQVEHGKPCLRKDENGVDPNRNYQMPRNYHHYRYASEEFEGPTPLSERGSRMVVKELEGVRRYINVHSGEFSLYMPYDSTIRRPPHFETMRDKLAQWHKRCPQCETGSAAATSFYKAFGTSVDWAIDHGVPEAYTFEIYGRETPDCDQMFNPPPERLEAVLDMWLDIVQDALHF